MANVVVLGAGVTGLTTALQLARDGHNVSIVAKHMPGDYDIEYASPWAGANFSPNLAASQDAKHQDSSSKSKQSQGQSESLASRFERDTWPELERLARERPETGIHFQESRVLKRSKDPESTTAAWFYRLLANNKKLAHKSQYSLLDSFRELRDDELPSGHDKGIAFTSVCINTALYLPWLASQCLKLGVNIRRGIVTHIADAANLHHSGKPADVVINATGLSSLSLGGVEDAALFPGRGQVVVVRNDPGCMYGVSGTDDSKEETTYLMTRGAGGGCVLGGCVQVNNWESQPDPNLAIRIMKRCIEVTPNLVQNGKGIDGLSVIRHGVGLRPMRKGSIRLEKETIDGVLVVHNYGHGGYGYQTSYGAAEAVKKLVGESIRRKASL